MLLLTENSDFLKFSFFFYRILVYGTIAYYSSEHVFKWHISIVSLNSPEFKYKYGDLLNHV